MQDVNATLKSKNTISGTVNRTIIVNNIPVQDGTIDVGGITADDYIDFKDAVNRSNDNETVVSKLNQNLFKLDNFHYLNWESGQYDGVGNASENISRIRLVDYFEIDDNSSIEFNDSYQKLAILFYDSNKNFIGNNGGNWIINSPISNLNSYFTNAKYARLVAGSINNASITNIDAFSNDIKITGMVSSVKNNTEKINNINDEIVKINRNSIIENVKLKIKFEEGAIDVINGQDTPGSDKARSEYIPISSDLKIEFDSSVKIIILFYDSNKNYLGRSGTSWITETPVENLTYYYNSAKYLKIVVSKGNINVLSVPNLVSVYDSLSLKNYVMNSVLKGKSIIVMGDSISDSSLTTQATKRYFDLLSENDGMTVIQDGWSGTGYVRVYGGHGTILTRINNFTYEAPDYISIFAGTNDWYGDAGEGKCELGVFGDSYESGSFYGVLDYTFNTLVTKYPTTSVIIALPIHRAWETSANQRGNTLEEFVEAIRKVAHKYSFTIVDLYNEGGINPLISASRIEYFTTLDGQLDGTHPNNKGHEKLYPKFREAILKS